MNITILCVLPIFLGQQNKLHNQTLIYIKAYTYAAMHNKLPADACYSSRTAVLYQSHYPVR